MGLSKTAEIAERLMGAGMPRETAAAVISRAGTPDQKVCVSDLAHLSKDAAEAGLAAPAVIVVGDVVLLRERLGVSLHRPLAGKRYLIPKIGTKTTRLAELLRERGACVQELKVGEIAYTNRRLTAEELNGTDWLVFTSKNGVQAFFRAMADSRLDLRRLPDCGDWEKDGGGTDALRAVCRFDAEGIGQRRSFGRVKRAGNGRRVRPVRKSGECGSSYAKRACGNVPV